MQQIVPLIECVCSDQSTAGIPIIVSILALVISMVTLALNRSTSFRIKRADIQHGFHIRFDKLQEDRGALLSRYAATSSGQPIDAEVNIFFDRFWSLQFDEFVAWQQGFIEHEVFKFWAAARWRQLRHPTKYWTIGEETIPLSYRRISNLWNPKGDCDSAKSAEERSRFGSMRLSRYPVVDFLDFFRQVSDASNLSEVNSVVDKFRSDRARLRGMKEWAFGAWPR